MNYQTTIIKLDTPSVFQQIFSKKIVSELLKLSKPNK
jgi:hypothetical protein